MKPTKEQISQLMTIVTTRQNVVLDDEQEKKLKQACLKCYKEHPNADIGTLTDAAITYLYYIVNFPDMQI